MSLLTLCSVGLLLTHARYHALKGHSRIPLLLGHVVHATHWHTHVSPIARRWHLLHVGRRWHLLTELANARRPPTFDQPLNSPEAPWAERVCELAGGRGNLVCLAGEFKKPGRPIDNSGEGKLAKDTCQVPRTACRAITLTCCLKSSLMSSSFICLMHLTSNFAHSLSSSSSSIITAAGVGVGMTGDFATGSLKDLALSSIAFVRLSSTSLL